MDRFWWDFVGDDFCDQKWVSNYWEWYIFCQLCWLCVGFDDILSWISSSDVRQVFDILSLCLHLSLSSAAHLSAIKPPSFAKYCSIWILLLPLVGLPLILSSIISCKSPSCQIMQKSNSIENNGNDRNLVLHPDDVLDHRVWGCSNLGVGICSTECPSSWDIWSFGLILCCCGSSFKYWQICMFFIRRENLPGRPMEFWRSSASSWRMTGFLPYDAVCVSAAWLSKSSLTLSNGEILKIVVSVKYRNAKCCRRVWSGSCHDIGWRSSAAFHFHARDVRFPVVKVVVWSRGAHLMKPGWSKPHTNSTPN